MQQTSQVRIDEETQERLKDLSEKQHEPKSKIVQKAVEDYHRKEFLRCFDEAYAVLKADQKAWEAEHKEQKKWEATINDGLKDK